MLFEDSSKNKHPEKKKIVLGRHVTGYISLLGGVEMGCSGIFLPSVSSGSSVFSQGVAGH